MIGIFPVCSREERVLYKKVSDRILKEYPKSSQESISDYCAIMAEIADGEPEICDKVVAEMRAWGFRSDAIKCEIQKRLEQAENAKRARLQN